MDKVAVGGFCLDGFENAVADMRECWCSCCFDVVVNGDELIGGCVFEHFGDQGDDFWLFHGFFFLFSRKRKRRSGILTTFSALFAKLAAGGEVFRNGDALSCVRQSEVYSTLFGCGKQK